MRPFSTTIPGYSRVGTGRPYKKLLEDLWSGATSEEEFKLRAAELRADRLQTQERLGLELIPCGDFSLYDHVLDTAVMLGCIPKRFGWQGGPVDHGLYFGLARGRDGIAALEMTKWFDTNYHYLVPELPERFVRTSNRPLEMLMEARNAVRKSLKPVILGPFTFLKLARLREDAFARRLAELLPIYEQLLSELAGKADLIQMDEPALVGDLSDSERTAFVGCYERLAQAGSPLLLQTYYGDLEPHWQAISRIPVAGWGLDFVRGREGNLRMLANHGFPAGKLLAAGVVDGRNIWRTNLDDAKEMVTELGKYAAPESLLLSSSCSLLHLPETVASEHGLSEAVQTGVCFAQERLGELHLLSQALGHGTESVAEEWSQAQDQRRNWIESQQRLLPQVQQRTAGLTNDDFTRPPYAKRLPLQRARIKLPLLPTTTIGSFPQTPELRRARSKAAVDPAGYRVAIEAEIKQVIRLQEEIGLDVLVHGEPERNDMVQFFGDQLHGFTTTRDGWVQSYGSRCVRPPIIYGDVERAGPMTVRETKLAQSLTQRPVKGMLTGPVTILQWSFVREDISRQAVAFQIALAIRDEALDLESEARVGIVQIDEPAFREGLPLRRNNWSDYLDWAVRAFRLATSGVAPHTQIHTHMCYSEFGDIIEAIAALDADVISIEDARSDGAMLRTLRDFRYPQQIGPGLYDIHSPNVPSAESLAARLQLILNCLPPDQVWVNPDCGLKTRTYAEVLPALRNMVRTAIAARNLLGERVARHSDKG